MDYESVSQVSVRLRQLGSESPSYNMARTLGGLADALEAMESQSKDRQMGRVPPDIIEMIKGWRDLAFDRVHDSDLTDAHEAANAHRDWHQEFDEWLKGQECPVTAGYDPYARCDELYQENLDLVNRIVLLRQVMRQVGHDLLMDEDCRHELLGAAIRRDDDKGFDARPFADASAQLMRLEMFLRDVDGWDPGIKTADQAIERLKVAGRLMAARSTESKSVSQAHAQELAAYAISVADKYTHSMRHADPDLWDRMERAAKEWRRTARTIREMGGEV